MRHHARPTLVPTAPGPAPDRPPTDTVALTSAVDAGLRSLRNLALVDGVIAAGAVEDRLHTALGSTRPDVYGRVAARVACAHLAAGALTDAYFALLTAREQLWEPRQEQYRELLTPRRHAAPAPAVAATPARLDADPRGGPSPRSRTHPR